MQRMPSVMNHNFSQVPKADIQRSAFDRSHGLKTTLDSAYLVPIFQDECVPGDTMALKMAGFGRLATPLFPFLDNLMLDTFFFAVPNRLLWTNWEKFMGQQDNPGDSTDYVVPVLTTPVGGHLNGTLADYFGLPTEEDIEDVNALHFRAYAKIWNDWFRDENLQDSIPFDTDDGPDVDTDYLIQKRGKRHDYFTSCLPWPQKNNGNAVSVPLGTEAPITGFGKSNQTYSLTNNTYYETDGTGTETYAKSTLVGDAIANYYMGVEEDPNNTGFPNLRVDLTAASSATINQWREAFQFQKLYERDARGGTRLPELILSHFGVSNPDQRMQRSEYLGGGHSLINVNPIAQTSSTDVTSPQGNLAAYATTQFNNHGFTKSFTEHCTLIGMVCVRADLNYQQGINRMWTRQTRWDYYWPALANIGEMAVLSKELFADGSAGDQDVFGYQERWAEMRYKPSQITGKMRSNYATSLDSWHLAQDFATRPVLNSTFIEENPPIDRVIAVVTEPELILDCYFHYRCTRPMPTYSVPGLMDHF